MTVVFLQFTGFQSPRSGKFVSDAKAYLTKFQPGMRFNPLDRGNLYQIPQSNSAVTMRQQQCFNPLDRGNLYQIHYCW